MPSRSELAAFLGRHHLTPVSAAEAVGVLPRTVEYWLEEGRAKTCPEPAWRLLLVLYGEAKIEDYKV